MNLIRFNLKPWERDELTPGVGTYLWPVAMAMDRAQADASKQASRG
jgi:hypothetical protein